MKRPRPKKMSLKEATRLLDRLIARLENVSKIITAEEIAKALGADLVTDPKEIAALRKKLSPRLKKQSKKNREKK